MQNISELPLDPEPDQEPPVLRRPGNGRVQWSVEPAIKEEEEEEEEEETITQEEEKEVVEVKGEERPTVPRSRSLGSMRAEIPTRLALVQPDLVSLPCLQHAQPAIVASPLGPAPAPPPCQVVVARLPTPRSPDLIISPRTKNSTVNRTSPTSRIRNAFAVTEPVTGASQTPTPARRTCRKCGRVRKSPSLCPGPGPGPSLSSGSGSAPSSNLLISRNDPRQSQSPHSTTPRSALAKIPAPSLTVGSLSIPGSGSSHQTGVCSSPCPSPGPGTRPGPGPDSGSS